jgi:polyisoprenoid-binding protein YceI
MKSTLILTFLTVLAFAGMSFTTIDTGKVETYSIDTEASKIEWRARKVTGKHNGSIMIKDGSLDFEEGVLKGGSFSIDMTTIAVLDLQAGKGKEKLEGHLKSADFFNVEEHNVANFTITKVFPIDTKGNYKISGDLTIKGNTNPVKFNASVAEEGGKITGTATDIEVDRSEYDIRYGSGSFFSNLGDKTIYDEFHLDVTLVASK